MDRVSTIEQAADEFIYDFGEQAVEVLQSRAEAAAELHDDVAAETWRKSADAAARKLSERKDQQEPFTAARE
jgi:hypothetical protein